MPCTASIISKAPTAARPVTCTLLIFVSSTLGRQEHEEVYLVSKMGQTEGHAACLNSKTGGPISKSWRGACECSKRQLQSTHTTLLHAAGLQHSQSAITFPVCALITVYV